MGDTLVDLKLSVAALPVVAGARASQHVALAGPRFGSFEFGLPATVTTCSFTPHRYLHARMGKDVSRFARISSSSSAGQLSKLANASAFHVRSSSMSQFLSRPAERPAGALEGAHGISTTLSKTLSIDHHQGSWLVSRSPYYPSLLLANVTSSVHSVHSQGSPCIGSGSFGSVYLVKEESGTLIAVKEIELRKLGPDKTVNEFELGKKNIRHPNIVEYLGVEIHPEKACIFLEYCEGGSLADILRCEGRISDEEVLLAYTLQILEALAYLHSCGIVHGDIKPASESSLYICSPTCQSIPSRHPLG